MDVKSIINEAVSETLAQARKEVNRKPSDAQIKAGNYKMGHVNILGFNITIENPKGSYRCGKDKNGKGWKTLMCNDYGYFTRTKGKDGDAIDVFIGPNLKSEKIYAVDQKVSGKFDETKVMLGFDSIEEAKCAYLNNYDKEWKGFDHITGVGLDVFKKWLYDGYRQRKPFYQYVEIKRNKDTEKMNENKKFRKFKTKEEYKNFLRSNEVSDWDKFKKERENEKRDSTHFGNFGKQYYIPNNKPAMDAFDTAKWGHKMWDPGKEWAQVIDGGTVYDNTTWQTDPNGSYQRNLKKAKEIHNSKFPNQRIDENKLNDIIDNIIKEALN